MRIGIGSSARRAVAVAIAVKLEFLDSILPMTKEMLKGISIPAHNYRSDLDFFVITAIPSLKYPALAFYEGLAPQLQHMLAKDSQQRLDVGLSDALKSLIIEGRAGDWDYITKNTLNRVTTFKEFIVQYSAIMK